MSQIVANSELLPFLERGIESLLSRLQYLKRLDFNLVLRSEDLLSAHLVEPLVSVQFETLLEITGVAAFEQMHRLVELKLFPLLLL